MEENKDYNPSQYEDDDRMEAPKSAKSIRGYQTIIVILAVILAALSILYFNIHRQQQEEYDLLLVDRDSIKSNLSHLMEDFDNLQISNDSISQSSVSNAAAPIRSWSGSPRSVRGATPRSRSTRRRSEPCGRSCAAICVRSIRSIRSTRT